MKNNIIRCKDVEGLSFAQIAKRYGIRSSEAYRIYKEGEYAWLDGLSNRAKNQIKRTYYKSFNALYNDVVHNDVDLETYSWIGHKVAQEVLRWLKPKNDRRKRERRGERR